MKNWERHREFLDKGDFHVHTSHTDGMNTVIEMCEQAEMNGLKLICFSEHVRRKIYYDFDILQEEIREARERFPGLRILSGCEAKVLNPEGDIDVSPEILEKAEILIVSFHDFHFGRKEDFLSAIQGALRHPRADIWGHPVTFLRNADLTARELNDVILACRRNRVLIEDSLAPKYAPPPGFLDACRKLGATLVTNSDAHAREELKKPGTA